MQVEVHTSARAVKHRGAWTVLTKTTYQIGPMTKQEAEERAKMVRNVMGGKIRWVDKL